MLPEPIPPWLARHIQDYIEREQAMVALCALTGIDYNDLRRRFNVWIETQPFSWRDGYERCLNVLRYSGDIPEFLKRD